MAGYPTLHVTVITLKLEVIWTGRLPHLPEVAHLHINRPLEQMRLNGSEHLSAPYKGLFDGIKQN